VRVEFVTNLVAQIQSLIPSLEYPHVKYTYS
jgi:hypothetical protein